MNIDLKDLGKAVDSINQDIFDSSGTEDFDISFSSNGYMSWVEFYGISLWDSEDGDARIYYEEDDEYEHIEIFLRRRLNEVIEKLKTIHV
jgi:hypothetical protein